MKYYLIHNGHQERKDRMLRCFENSKVNNNDVTWMIYPNGEDISDDLIKEIVASGLTYYANGIQTYAQQKMSKGLISCTYKHYLSLKDIVENNYDYAVIMEDNMTLGENIPERLDLYIKQLNDIYPDWDIIFDNAWRKYEEGEIKEGVYVYPKSNEITNQCHGGAKLAQFYLIRLKAAKKLYENYLPFNVAVDWYLNDLFRKLNIKSFWAEPSNVFEWKHTPSY